NEAASILHEAMQASWGPISQHGRLHDRASYRYYWTILQRARLTGLNLPEAASALLQSVQEATQNAAQEATQKAQPNATENT
ncbi:MAG TPA: hypothetical protein VF774_12045, partial [Pseudoduganella sp.]